LINSPKFVTPLVRQLEALGGIANIFLTHRDDVADAERYAKYFGSRRIIHKDELSSQPGAELVLEGKGPWELTPDFLALPTPGHTQGHCVLLFRQRFLFTGDHLDWVMGIACPFAASWGPWSTSSGLFSRHGP
jgi:glyoxylase-like metal-dependent hydrolase (beta-lactamase superfamily II)